MSGEIETFHLFQGHVDHIIILTVYSHFNESHTHVLNMPTIQRLTREWHGLTPERWEGKHNHLTIRRATLFVTVVS